MYTHSSNVARNRIRPYRIRARIAEYAYELFKIRIQIARNTHTNCSEYAYALLRIAQNTYTKQNTHTSCLKQHTSCLNTHTSCLKQDMPYAHIATGYALKQDMPLRTHRNRICLETGYALTEYAHVCVCVRACVRSGVCACVRARVHVCVCVFVCARACEHVRARTHACAHV